MLDLGLMPGEAQCSGLAQYVIMCMVCGSLGELSKLRAYSFKFWFQLLPLARGKAWDDRIAHTTVSAWDV